VVSTHISGESGESISSLVTLDQWMASIHELYSIEEIEKIYKAASMAMVAHKHQKRMSGEPYVSHVFEVASILVSLHLDSECVIAAILHDIVEDTDVNLEKITDVFGTSISKLVDGVTKMKFVKEVTTDDDGNSKREWGNAESLRKMLLAMVDDVRVILIKLADRLHNMRTLKYLGEKQQKRIAAETLEIFAPLANRMGIWQVKWELEDLSFRYLYPEKYKNIARLLDERRQDRETFIDNVIATLGSELSKHNIKYELSGRPKHIYSIWKKMERKGVSFQDIFDVSAVRVLVDTVANCYAVLGLVHGLWKHIPNEFDDYIATPKGNNYQSLHTAVLGPNGKAVEIQIRTYEMHEHSELGVASHWRYKEGGKLDPGFEEKIVWLRQLLEWKDEEADADGFVDRFKSEIFEDRVYVLTPKGNVVDLAAGATPLDFAYHIHTEIGHGCRGAKINGSIVPLTYTLQTGDQIEILSSKTLTPSRDWLNPHLGYLKTSRSRAKVRSWFTHQDLEKNIQAGRQVFEKELSKLGLTKLSHDEIAQQLKLKDSQEMYAGIGKGDISVVQIVTATQELINPLDPDVEAWQKTATVKTPKSIQGDVQICGVGNLLTTMARCCKPAPGDEIIGYITKGRGITIHRADCTNVCCQEDERLIEVSWNQHQETTYPVDIMIQAYDRQGLLRDVTQILTDEKANVMSMNTVTDINDQQVNMSFTLEVSDIHKLSRVLSRISQLPNILEVRRTTS